MPRPSAFGGYMKIYKPEKQKRQMRADDLLDAFPVNFYVIDLKQRTIVRTNDVNVQTGDESCFKQLFNKKEPCGVESGRCLCEQLVETGSDEELVIENEQGRRRVFFKVNVKQVTEDLAIAMFFDITDKLTAEKKWHESLADFCLTQEIARIGNWKYDPENNTLHWSEQIPLIFDDNDIPVHPDIQYFKKLIAEEHFVVFENFVNKALNKGKAFEHQFLIKHSDKAEKWIEIICKPDKKRGQAGYFLRGTIQDITVTKRIEEELKSAKQKAEESDRLKSLFLANTSHEIRTPLNGILGFSNIICSGDADPEQLAYFGKIIQSCGQRLTNVIDDIVDISLIQSNQLKVDFNTFDIDELLEELFVFYRAQETVKLQKIEFKVSLCGNSSYRVLHTDKKRLIQVLKNLIDNAFKFTGEGFIRFGCFSFSENEMVLFVEDSGIGIEDEKINMVFEAFRQAQEGFSRQYEGTGLGLPIVSGIMRRLGGKVWVESEAGKGSVFYVSIPRNEEEILSENDRSTQLENKKEESPVRKKIVSFEDDPGSIEYLKSVVNLMGHEIINFEHPTRGLEYLRENPADLILMDVRLPGMNGLEATRIIKSEFPNLPVIIQTAYTMRSDREKAFQAGCDDYLAKPVSLKALRGKIDQFARKVN